MTAIDKHSLIRAQFRAARVLCLRGIAAASLAASSPTTTPWLTPTPIMMPKHFIASGRLLGKGPFRNVYASSPQQAPTAGVVDGGSDQLSTSLVPGKDGGKARAQVAPLVVPQEVLPRACVLKPKEMSPKATVEKASEASRKRVSPLSIRVPKAHKELLRTKAKAAGLSIGSYMLRTALKGDYKPPQDPEWTKALLAANRELTRQGTNLNQLAHKRNTSLIDEAQTNSMLGILARAYLQSHQAVRKALAHGKEPQP